MEDDIGQEEPPDIAGAPHDVDGISPGNKFQLCNSLSKYNLTNLTTFCFDKTAALTAASLLMDDKQHLSWSRIAIPNGTVNPPRRSGAASVVVKGKLYMFGVSTYFLSVPI